MTTLVQIAEIQVFRPRAAKPCRHCARLFQHQIHNGCPCSGEVKACPHCGCPTAQPINGEEAGHGR